MAEIQFIIVFCLILGWFAEWRIHTRNFRFLIDQGAVETTPMLSQTLYFLLILAPLAVIFEGTFYPKVGFQTETKAFFIGLLGISSVLRWWAIDSVNRLWTYRCLAHPNLRHWSVGPYRFMGHPEYLSRILDIVSLSVIFEGVFSGGLFTVLAAGLSLRLILVEQTHYLTMRGLKNTG